MEIRKVLIVEDDASSMEMLARLIEEVNPSSIIFRATKAAEVYRIIHENLIDLFLLDIILNTKDASDLTGINIAEEIRTIDKYKFTPIIFITSLEDPEMYSYKELHSFKYIEKPIHINETKQVISEAIEYKTMPVKEKVLHFRKGGIIYTVKENDIIYMESRLHLLRVYTKNEYLEIPYKTCKGMLSVLDSELFVQCSKSVIVNREYIKNVDTVNRYIELEFGYKNVAIGKKYLEKVVEGVVVC